MPAVLNEDHPTVLGVLVGATDVDGEALSVSAAHQSQYGRLEQNAAAQFVHTRNANFLGIDRFAFEVTALRTIWQNFY